jgi:hypothetical protein
MKYCAKCRRMKLFNFCIFCFKKTGNSFILKATPAHFEFTFNRTKFTHKRSGVKKFVRQVIIGWMPTKGKNSKKHPRGVFVRRIIDRKKDKYKEEIVDRKTGTTIIRKEEPLSQHKLKRQNPNY